MSSSVNLVCPEPIVLEDFYGTLSQDCATDELFKRLEANKAKAENLSKRLENCHELKMQWLHSAIGPLINMNRKDISTLVKAVKQPADNWKKNEFQALIQDFMVNQAQRLFDFLNLVIRQKNLSVNADEVKVTIKINDQEYLLHYREDQCPSRGNLHSLKFANNRDGEIFPPYYEYKFEPSVEGVTRSKKYHISGFDVRTDLQTFKLSNGDKREQLIYQQGTFNGRTGGKLRVSLTAINDSTSFDEHVSWYSDPLKQTSVAEQVVSMGKYLQGKV